MAAYSFITKNSAKRFTASVAAYFFITTNSAKQFTASVAAYFVTTKNPNVHIEIGQYWMYTVAWHRSVLQCIALTPMGSTSGCCARSVAS